jgi:hypothetical protein
MENSNICLFHGEIIGAKDHVLKKSMQEDQDLLDTIQSNRELYRILATTFNKNNVHCLFLREMLP